MATGTIILPILSAVPDSSNPPGLAFTSTLLLPYLTFDGGSTNEICTFQFRMPVDYSSAPVLNVQWAAASATSGDVKWAAQILAVTGNTDSGAIDSETYAAENPSTASTVDSHLGTTATRLHDYALTLSNTDSVAADDFVSLKFYRDASDTTNDTMTGDAWVFALSLEYTTT